MNILVLDVAASESGALTILQQYYKEFQLDDRNHYFLCVSKPQLESTERVTVLRYPWVKKSWIHRLWFEMMIVPALIRKNNIGRLFSLQNLILSNPSCERWIYLHNSLPFIDISFSFRKEPLMWVYQNVLGRIIFSSIKRADKVIVQTEWMKKACINRVKLCPERIEVSPPDVKIQNVVMCADRERVKSRLFYPATPLKYKNHIVVLQALKKLKEQGKIGNLTLDLTLQGNENDLAKYIFDFVQQNDLPVNFLGQLSRQQVMEHYSESTLIFPSYVETVGLPLLEAKLSNTIVLASDCSFSNEILREYDGVKFFNPFDVDQLSELLENYR